MTVKVFNRTKGRFVDQEESVIALSGLEAVSSPSILGRVSAGTGAVQVLTVTTVKEMLGIVDGASGLSYVPMTIVSLDSRIVSFDAEPVVHAIEFLDTFMLIGVLL